jgi:hypothetical protein
MHHLHSCKCVCYMQVWCPATTSQLHHDFGAEQPGTGQHGKHQPAITENKSTTASFIV